MLSPLLAKLNWGLKTNQKRWASWRSGSDEKGTDPAQSTNLIPPLNFPHSHPYHLGNCEKQDEPYYH